MIYNTGKIPPQQADAMIDSPPDPSMLKLIDVSPMTIDEGQGVGGSRPVVLVIHGENLVNADVAIMGATVMIDKTQLTISHDSTLLAVPVTVPVDTSANEGASVVLTVQVTQPGAMPQTIGGPKLLAHDELTTATATPAAMYSQITLSSDYTLPATGSTSPFVLRSMSSIEVKAITAKGGDGGAPTAGMAGAGALPGGANAAKGGGTGGGNQGTDGTNGVLGSPGGDGGGAGFANTGTAGGGNGGGSPGNMYGDGAISTYPNNAPSGGGGGGRNATAVLGPYGNAGGGGGGGSVVELTAGGILTCGPIDVTGGRGGDGGSGTGGGGGGGGAGGVIVLRAGGTLTSGMLTASGGAGGAASGTATGNGGVGSVGRIRWDNATAASVPASPTAVRGPAFVSPPLITSSQMLSLVGAPGKTLGISINGTAAPDFSFDGSGNASVMAPLAAGYNRVCVGVANGDAALQDCIDLAYLP